MKTKLVLCVVFLVILTWAPPLFSQRVLIVVRHAEKVDDSHDPPLAKAGQERAQRLAGLLREVGVEAIYTTEFQRTIKTVEPLAELLGVESKIVLQNDPNGLVEKIRSQHKDDIVLVAGHRSTVPKILKGLGCREEIALTFDEYNNLFMMIPTKEGSPVTLQLKF